ncbi:MAG: TRAP transporter substrate-binding protein [Succinivibrionaceae bacterium]|nr:TRAP transporter substrate-binding protein [Succinivibrionaceae bacterium]
MNKKIALTAIAVAVAGLCCANAANAAYNIRIGHYAGDTHPVTKSLQYFAENLEKESNGEIKVKQFPNNQLGPEAVIVDQIKRGTVQMAVTGSQIKKDEPNIGLSDAPYLISSWDQARAVYDEEGQKIMSGNYEKNTGVKILGYMVNGFREVSANRPITSLEDFGKLKLRIPDNEIHVHLFEALGSNNVMMPLSEVYNALETHMIDGQENPYSTILASGFYEVQSDILETRHMFAISPLLINGKFYNKLPDNLKALVDKWAKKTIEYNWELSQKDDEASKKALQDKGIKIHEMTPEMKKAIDDKMVAYYDWFSTIIPDAKKWVEHCKARAGK